MVFTTKKALTRAASKLDWTVGARVGSCVKMKFKPAEDSEVVLLCDALKEIALFPLSMDVSFRQMIAC